MVNANLSTHLLEQADFLAISQSLVLKIRRQVLISAQEFNLAYFAGQDVASYLTSAERLELAANLKQMFALDVMVDSWTTFGALAKDLATLWQDSAQTVTFTTSGSTGKPKFCLHTAQDLAEEALSLCPLIADVKRVLVTVPIHHLYGFIFGLILPKILKLPVEACTALPSIVSAKAENDDLVVTMPLLLKKISQLSAGFKCCQVISATMPLDTLSGEFLEHQGIALLEIFGSSETGVLGTRKSLAEPFTLRPYFSKVEQEEAVVRRQAHGQAKRYPLQDNFIWPTERTFWPQGRLDAAIQIGGVNVYPEKIKAYLCRHPKVKTCAVRLDQNLGRIKAFIVLSQGEPTQSLRQELRSFVKEGLTSFEQPVRFDFGEELPKNELGKFVDWG